jgi:hypothetical protein
VSESIWVCFPTCNPDRARPTISKWKDAGYKTACYLDPHLPSVGAHLEFFGKYAGYYEANNVLIRLIQRTALMFLEPARVTVVVAGDDMDPDPKQTPGQIASSCYSAYGDTWVMQPIGDDQDGVDRICGSPWLSHGWLHRAYEGRFPLPPWYVAFYGDEEMQNVAIARGVFHQRADICQYHHHWARPGGEKRTPYQEAHSKKDWDPDKAIFMDRKSKGWPLSGLKEE